MTKVIAYIDKLNSDGSLHSRKKAQILSSEVTKNGERASDTGKFKFSANTSCKQGDIVKYIQDVAEADFLKGIWNFYNNFRDEGGYDQDGVTTNDTGNRFLTDLDGRVASFVNSVNDTVIIPYNAIIDLSGQFDIYIYCKPFTTPTSQTVLLSKTDATKGIEIGIGAGHKVEVRIYDSGITTMLGSIADLFTNTPHWIRLFRNVSGDIKCYVDGTLEATLHNTADLSSVSSIIFGADHTDSAKLYTGKLAQVRIYCGGILNDKDDFDVRNSIRQPETMKFAGVAWQGSDQTEDKTVYANGFGRELIDIKSKPATQGNIIGNDTDAIHSGAQILFALTETYASKFRYYDEGGLSTLGDALYSGVDDLLKNLSIVSLEFDSNFYINARRVIMTEPKNIDHTQLKFVNGKGYKIISQGTDDTALVNDLEIIGSPLSLGNVQKFNGNNTIGQVFALAITGQFYGVFVRDTGTGLVKYESLDFTVNYISGAITTLTAFPIGVNNIEIQIVTQDLSNNPLTKRFTDNTSITKNGKHAKSITLQQITAGLETTGFGTNFINRYKDVNKRITIQAPVLLNSLRPNYYIHVINSILGIDGNFVVRAITWKYPEFTTEVLVGEYIFNAFDLRNQDVTKTNQNYVVTPRALNAGGTGGGGSSLEGNFTTWTQIATFTPTFYGNSLIVIDEANNKINVFDTTNSKFSVWNLLTGGNIVAETTMIISTGHLWNSTGSSILGKYVVIIISGRKILIYSNGVLLQTIDLTPNLVLIPAFSTSGKYFVVPNDTTSSFLIYQGS